MLIGGAEGNGKNSKFKTKVGKDKEMLTQSFNNSKNLGRKQFPQNEYLMASIRGPESSRNLMIDPIGTHSAALSHNTSIVNESNEMILNQSRDNSMLMMMQ